MIEHQLYFRAIKNLKLNEEFEVNYGGCGCFALLIIEIFKKRKIKQLEIIYYDTLSKIPNHVFLSDGEYYYDCDGVHEIEHIKGSTQIVTEKNLRHSLTLIREKVSWNRIFNRGNMNKIRVLVTEIITGVQASLVELAAVAA